MEGRASITAASHKPPGSADRLVLHGSFMSQNYGDVLLMLIYERWVRENARTGSVVVASAGTYSRKFLNPDTLTHGRAVFGARGLLYAGGGYFGEPQTTRLKERHWRLRFLKRHLWIGEWFKCRGTPVAIIGVGVGPLRNRLLRNRVVGLFDHATLVAVRDIESKAFLTDYGLSPEKVMVTADAALGMTRDAIPTQALIEADQVLTRLHTPRRIGVHLDRVGSDSAMWEQLVRAVRQYAREREDTGFVFFTDRLVDQTLVNTSTTNHWFGRLSQELQHRCITVQCGSPWLLTALLGRIDGVITTKLHVGIVALWWGTQVISIPFHHKIPRFYRQIGHPQRCIQLGEPARHQLLEAMRTYFTESVPVLSLNDKVVQAAQRNRMLVHSFLDDLQWL